MKGICTLAGIIDAGYRGEITVVLANFGPELFDIAAGDRIAQLVVARAVQGRKVALQVVTASPQEFLEQFGGAVSRVLERVVEERADRATRHGLEVIAIGIQIAPHRDARERIEGVSLATRRRSLHLVAGGTDLRDVCAAHAVDLDA